MKELVLALHRPALAAQGIYDTGLCAFNPLEIPDHDYALLPRHIAGNKTSLSVDLGFNNFGQVIAYMQLVDEEGRILLYQRKSKDGVLEGKWSIGVGGHVSHEDLITMLNESCDTDLPDFWSLLLYGTKREFLEETGLSSQWFDPFEDVYAFKNAINKVIVSDADVTSKVHIGIPIEVPINTFKDNLHLDEDEFLNERWLSKEELINLLTCKDVEFETWSRLLIENYIKEALQA